MTKERIAELISITKEKWIIKHMYDITKEQMEEIERGYG